MGALVVRVSAAGSGAGLRTSGVDPKHTDRVFEVFERFHTHDEHDGGGIGLAICERIIEHHGGDIEVESEPGDGATFYFTLPPADEEEEPRAPGQSPSLA